MEIERKDSSGRFSNKSNDYTTEMNKTSNDGFKSNHKSARRTNSSLNNSRSQKACLSNPKTLFKNDGIIDKIDNTADFPYGSDIKASQGTIVRDKPESIPYPHLAAFINKHSGGVHFGKRMKIQGIQTSKEIHDEQSKQLKEKELRTLEENVKSKQQEYFDMLKMKDDALRDEIEREIDSKNKKEEFKNSMIQMQEEKKQKERHDKEIKLAETYDYFPFTHGEKIESMKENLRQIVISSNKAPSNNSVDEMSNKNESNPQCMTSSELHRTGLTNPLANEYAMENPILK